VRGGTFETREGTSRSRNVGWNSRIMKPRWPATIRPEYAHLVKIRSPHAASDLVIIEGYDGPQP